jgi:hypothetical protein
VQVIDDDGARQQLHRRLHARFHLVHELTQPHRTGHARAALDRVQFAHQIARQFAIIRVGSEAAQIGCDLRQEIGRLCEEDLEQVRIDLVADTWRRRRLCVAPPRRRGIGSTASSRPGCGHDLTDDRQLGSFSSATGAS